jgi:lipopolysaccharide transport system ATP-binding protein
MTHTARGIWQRMRHPLSPNRESIDLEELWAVRDAAFKKKCLGKMGNVAQEGRTVLLQSYLNFG